MMQYIAVGISAIALITTAVNLVGLAALAKQHREMNAQVRQLADNLTQAIDALRRQNASVLGALRQIDHLHTKLDARTAQQWIKNADLERAAKG